MSNSLLTRKQLRAKTGGVPSYIISYLYDAGRLPVARESNGPGHPRLYKPEAVEVVKAHVKKGKEYHHAS